MYGISGNNEYMTVSLGDSLEKYRISMNTIPMFSVMHSSLLGIVFGLDSYISGCCPTHAEVSATFADESVYFGH